MSTKDIYAKAIFGLVSELNNTVDVKKRQYILVVINKLLKDDRV